MGTRTVRAREGWNPKQVPRTEVEMMVQDFSQCFVCCLPRHLRWQQRQQRIPDSQLGHSSVTLSLTHNTSSNTPGAPAATQPEFHLKRISCLQNPPICFSRYKATLTLHSTHTTLLARSKPSQLLCSCTCRLLQFLHPLPWGCPCTCWAPGLLLASALPCLEHTKRPSCT